MKKLRRVIFWCHLPVGVIAGVVILIMCVTGVLLIYEKQITARAWTRAEQQVSDWRSISMQLPTAASTSLTFNIDSGTGGQPQKRAQLVLDRATNDPVRWEPFSTYTRGRQLRSILRFAHTGEVLGVAGQTIAALVSAGGALLALTGLALAIRRLLAWRSRRYKLTQPTIAEPIPNPAGD